MTRLRLHVTHSRVALWRALVLLATAAAGARAAPTRLLVPDAVGLQSFTGANDPPALLLQVHSHAARPSSRFLPVSGWEGGLMRRRPPRWAAQAAGQQGLLRPARQQCLALKELGSQGPASCTSEHLSLSLPSPCHIQAS